MPLEREPDATEQTESGRQRLVLIRHGETEWSRSRRHTGRSDVQLTPHGRDEARHIAASVAAFDFSHAFTSPLSRAAETAQLVGLDATTDDDLLEWDYGDYEGVTTAEIRTTIPGWTVWTHPVTGGESTHDVCVRVDRAIARMLELDGTIALVAHAHLLRMFAARWIGLDARDGRRFTLETATMSILGWEREHRVIHRWNDPCGRL